MSNCVVIDTVDWLGAGVVSIGDTGFGVLGSSIPSTGTNGPGYAYSDISLPADANTEICGRITAWPTRGTLIAYEDTSFVYTANSDGADSFTYQLYKAGVASGSPITQTLQVGGTNGTATGATLTGTSSLTPGGATGTGSASVSGANLIGSGTISGGAATGVQVFDGNATGAAMTGQTSFAGGAASVYVPPLPVNPAMYYAHPGIGWNFPDMIAGDIDTLSYNFASMVPPGVSIASVVPNMVVHAGIDPDPETVVINGPTINGTIVSIQVHPTLAGVSYWPRVSATLSDGEKVTLPLHGEGSLTVDL